MRYIYVKVPHEVFPGLSLQSLGQMEQEPQRSPALTRTGLSWREPEGYAHWSSEKTWKVYSGGTFLASAEQEDEKSKN